MTASKRAEAHASGPVERDNPWLIRTYSGHSTAAKSNALYRRNLAKGQTGLSIAFDLPTQTGYDSDHGLARGEVGKVGVPVCHLGDMRTLLDAIPLEAMNTSMTINATAAWLLALYVAVADEQGAARDKLTGTTQNDIIKEYLSRGTYVFPPEPSLRLTKDTVVFSCRTLPKWNPVNVCSYHLQEAGATPVQEMAFALATAQAILDTVRDSGEVPPAEIGAVVGRISFFVNAGVRFVTEMCKMRAFTELWDEITAERYRVADLRHRRFRYGVQVNSLGLTEPQAENNVYRILLSMLAVTLSKDARARAVQLPAWNEALGLPRPWDQQWSIRMQQILAYETDLLEYPDLFDGSAAVRRKVDELKAAAKAELARIEAMGGVVVAIDWMKRALVESNTERLRKVESGEQVLVGVNRWAETEPSPLAAGAGAIEAVDGAVEKEQVERLAAWRAGRDGAAVNKALAELEAAAREGRNVMEPSIACAKAGVTTGEWGAALRSVFGEYRAPTGV
ncbi:MAG: methylmalonyl-CoA mutase family protein, partial [Hyphomicrobiaceae bacterium]